MILSNFDRDSLFLSSNLKTLIGWADLNSHPSPSEINVWKVYKKSLCLFCYIEVLFMCRVFSSHLSRSTTAKKSLCVSLIAGVRSKAPTEVLLCISRLDLESCAVLYYWGFFPFCIYFPFSRRWKETHMANSSVTREMLTGGPPVTLQGNLILHSSNSVYCDLQLLTSKNSVPEMMID